MMKLTWLVVADNSRARIFSTNMHKGPIDEIESIVHTEARLHEQELTTDLPGRGNGKGGAGRHAYEDETSPREQEEINFARDLANKLDAARKANKFKQLILVAAPGFLGNLRSKLNPQIQNMVSFELAKNLAHLNADDIRQHLPERLPGS